MEVGALIISMVALAAAGFALWFQWRMFQASTGQLTEAQKVLSKLEGVSLQLRETQEKQYSSLLNAVVGMVKKQGAEAADEAAARLEERVAELEASGVDYEEVKEAVEDFRRQLAERVTLSTFGTPKIDSGPLGSASAERLLSFTQSPISLDPLSVSFDPEGRIRLEGSNIRLPSDVDEGRDVEQEEDDGEDEADDE